MEWTFMIVGSEDTTLMDQICPIDTYEKMVSTLSSAGYSPYDQLTYKALDITHLRRWESEVFGVLWVHERAISIDGIKPNVREKKVFQNRVEVVFEVPLVKE